MKKTQSTKNERGVIDSIYELIKGEGVIDVYVTPDLASKILELSNKRNRRMSEATVRDYASCMARGLWRQNQQNSWIGFYDNGVLADGQHRLMAILRSGISMMMRFERGLKKEHSFAIDTHRSRTAFDQVFISGKSDWINKDHMAMASALIITNGGNQYKTSPEFCMELCEKMKDGFIFADSALSSHKKGVTKSSVKAAVAVAHNYVEKNKLIRFCEVLTSGICASPLESSAIRLREMLMGNIGIGSGSKGRVDQVNLTMAAIHKFGVVECKVLRKTEAMPYSFEIQSLNFAKKK